MKKIHLSILTMVLFLTANSQVPAGLPSPSSTGYAKYGYMGTDSAGIAAKRDSLWNPKYIGSWVYWQHAGVDTSFWVFNGNTTGSRWDKVVFVKPGHVGYVPYTGAISNVDINSKTFSTTSNVSAGNYLFGNGGGALASYVSGINNIYSGTSGINISDNTGAIPLLSLSNTVGNMTLLGTITASLPNATGDFVTASVGGKEGRRTPSQTRTDIGALGIIDTSTMLSQYHYKADQTRILGEPGIYNAFPQACTLNDTAWVIYSGNGTNHTGKFDIVAQYSTDGNNWTKQTLLTNASFSYPNHGGGVNDIGEILVFIEVTTGGGTNWTTYNTMNCYKKVGNSLVLISANLPLNGCTEAAPFGKLVVLPSGALLQTVYGDIGSTRKCYTIISTDHGVTWTFNSNIISSTQPYTEVSMTKVSGISDGSSTILAAVRNSTAMELFISKNGGTAWATCGLIEPTQSILAVAPWLDVFNGNVMLMYGDRSYGLMRTIQYDSIYVDSATVYTNITTNAVVNKVVQYSSLLNTKANGDQTSGSFGYGSFFILKNILFYTCYDIDQNQRPPYGTGSTRLQTNIITNRFYQEIQAGQAYGKTVNSVDSLTGVQDEITINGVYNTPKVGVLSIGTPQPIAFTSSPTYAALFLQSQASALSITNRSHLSTDNILNKFANGGDSLYVGVEASVGGSTFGNTDAYAGILGTIANLPLEFATNNTKRGGWLGNGTFVHGSSNQFQIDVSGNISASTLSTSGSAFIGSSLRATSAIFSQSGSDGNISINSQGRFTTILLQHAGVTVGQQFWDNNTLTYNIVNSVAGGAVVFKVNGAATGYSINPNGTFLRSGLTASANTNRKIDIGSSSLNSDTISTKSVVAAGGLSSQYFAADGSIQTVTSGGGGISGLTTNVIPKATSSTSIGDGQITDNGTVIQIGGSIGLTDPKLQVTANSTTSGGALALAANSSTAQYFIKGSDLGTGTSPFTVDATGTITSNALAGVGIRSLAATAGGILTVTSTSAVSGTYTPTYTGITNISAITPYAVVWSINGNAVTISGIVDIDPTIVGNTEFTISLPSIASSAIYRLGGGTGFAGTVGGEGFSIYTTTTGSTLTGKYSASSTANNQFTYSVTYYKP